MGVFKLGGMTLKSLFKKAPTRRYPHEVREPFERTRGQIDMADMKNCILCGMCERKCPALCIRVDKAAETWTYEPYKCIACDSCVRACPKKVLVMKQDRPPVATALSSVEYTKSPLTPEEIAEKERKEAEKKAKIQAALAAEKERKEAEKKAKIQAALAAKKAKEEAARKAADEQAGEAQAASE